MRLDPQSGISLPHRIRDSGVLHLYPPAGPTLYMVANDTSLNRAFMLKGNPSCPPRSPFGNLYLIPANPGPSLQNTSTAFLSSQKHSTFPTSEKIIPQLLSEKTQLENRGNLNISLSPTIFLSGAKRQLCGWPVYTLKLATNLLFGKS